MRGLDMRVCVSEWRGPARLKSNGKACLEGEKNQNPGVPFSWRTRKVMWLANPLEISAWQRDKYILCCNVGFSANED